MNSNSDGNAEARENPDDTVWPPPPTGPRVVAVRLPAQSVFFLPIPESLSGFRVPKWTKSAWNYLFFAVVMALMYTKSPTPAKVLIGCGVLGIGTLMLDFFVGAGIVAYARVVSAVTGKVHTPANRDGKDFMPDAWLKISPRLMFLVRGIFFLFGSYRYLINRIAFVFWLALIVAGLGVAAVNGVNYWLVSRLEGGRLTRR